MTLSRDTLRKRKLPLPHFRAALLIAGAAVAVLPISSIAAIAQDAPAVGPSDGAATPDQTYSYSGFNQFNSLVVDSGNILEQFSGSNYLLVNTSFTTGSVSAGVFLQSAGTTVCGTLLLGVGTNASGTVTLTGGSLASTASYIGENGFGDFYQGGGTFTTSALYLGGSAAANVGAFGFVSMSNGSSFVVSGNEYYGAGSSGIGIFGQSGGTHTVSGTVYIGYGSGSLGVLGQSGGTFSAAAVSNNGILDISGGCASIGTISGTGQAYIGSSGTSSAMVTATSIAGVSLTIRNNSILSLSSPSPATNTISQLTVSGSNNAIYLSGVNASITLGCATLQADTTLSYGATSGTTVPLSVTGSLTINDGSQLAILSNASGGVTNTISSLAINGGGQLDLANSGLITSTPSNTIRQYLINGFNNGAWNGTGGISSVNANANYNIPASNGGHFTALGYSSGTTIAALHLTAGQTLVKYTIYGDANLDGTVDINDLNIVASNFLSGNPGTWDTGDFYYAGETDISDLNAVLSNYFDSAPSSVRAANAAVKFKASTASTAKTLTGTVSPADTVSPPPANGVLELVVNTTSGDVELEGNNADIASLQITSASSSIITANWTDLHANGYTNWSDTAKKKTGIGEYDNQFTATGDYAVLGVVDYGDIYNTTVNAEDYVFKYGSVESNDTTVDTDTGSVIYVTPEPTTLSLMGLAAAGLLGRRRKGPRERNGPCQTP
jgi:hypothetical protein